MLLALWVLLAIYAVSLTALVLGRIAVSRSAPFRRFLIGDPTKEEVARGGRSG